MKIIILLRHDADDFKGEMIAAHNRSKELLKNYPNADVQVLVLREYFNSFFCKLRDVKKIKKEEGFIYEGVSYKALWFDFSPIDNLLVKFHKRPFMIFWKLNKFVKLLKDADIVIAHSTYAGYVALKAKQKYNIPYTITWHGTDIHTMPLITPYLKELTCSIIENAACNCFVSKDLLLKSESLTTAGRKEVLYNGVDRVKFRFFSKSEKEEIRIKFGIDDDCVNIAFIGNLYPVKNVLSLPAVFKIVKEKYTSDKIRFHFIGDGQLRTELKRLCDEVGIDYKMWGNQPADLMPSYINCMNLVVLPSFNEGLPLISVETLSCGVPMVGSRVGGIPEAIGIENTVDLGDKFVNQLAELIVSKLIQKSPVFVSDDFSWAKTGEKEKQIINNILRQ